MESPGNSKREHDFRRLLRATEKMLHGGVLATHDAVSERQLRLELNRLNVFVETLYERLAELIAMDVGSLPPQSLASYQVRLDDVTRAVQACKYKARRPLLNTTTHSVPPLQEEDDRVPTSQVPRAFVDGRPEPTANERLTPHLRGTSQEMTGGGSGRAHMGRRGQGTSQRGASTVSQDRETREALARDQHSQQALKEQLEELVAALKASSMLIHNSLREQNRVLDRTDDVATRNLQELQKEVKKTEEHLKRSWSGTFTSFVLILLVLGAFLILIPFMKLFPKRRLLLS